MTNLVTIGVKIYFEGFLPCKRIDISQLWLSIPGNGQQRQWKMALAHQGMWLRSDMCCCIWLFICLCYRFVVQCAVQIVQCGCCSSIVAIVVTRNISGREGGYYMEGHSLHCSQLSNVTLVWFDGFSLWYHPSLTFFAALPSLKVNVWRKNALIVSSWW